MLKKLFRKKKPVQNSETQIPNASLDQFNNLTQTVDVSFIPEDVQSAEIKSLNGLEYIYPYNRDDTYRFPREYYDLIDNYYAAEDTLGKLAYEQMKNGEVMTAKLTYEYLLQMGTKISPYKENLLKIYKKQGNEKDFSLVVGNIKSQLKEEKDYHYQKEKLKKVLVKYKVEF